MQPVLITGTVLCLTQNPFEVPVAEAVRIDEAILIAAGKIVVQC